MTRRQARSPRKLPDRLLDLSESLLAATSEPGRPDPARLRRSISTAYYALFSLLVEAGAAALAGTGPQSKELRALLARTFQHSEMSNVWKGFANRNPADRAAQAFTAWNAIKATPEAKVFLLALVFDKKAERRA